MQRMRLLEWSNSLLIFLLGLVMWLAPMSFQRPGLAPFSDHAIFWTVSCLVIGAARLIALWINGHWQNGTPLIRLAGATLGTGIFAAFTMTFLAVSTWESIALGVLVFGVPLLTELVNAGFTAKDVVHTRKYR